MKLGIVGSQQKWFQTDAQYRIAGQTIKMIFSYYDVDLFISGGCNGIDLMAESQADHLGISKRIHLPKYQSWEQYKARNILIAQDCDVLYSIRSQFSKTYGSGWTADYAESLGKEVFRYVF